MKRVCAWCKIELEPTNEGPSGAITHGICKECLLSLKAKSGIKFSNFLDHLNAPVLLIKSDGVVELANEKAKNILGKEQIPEDKLPGDVIECSYSYLPGGCGKTKYCAACLIRKAVMETHKDGEKRLYTETKLTQKTDTGSVTLNVTISTEKVNDVVLLRIDKIYR